MTPSAPEWWHPKGRGMAVIPQDPAANFFRLLNPERAEVFVFPRENSRSTCWLRWKVIHPYGDTGGRFHLRREELQDIFGLAADWRASERSSEHRFFRQGPFLNIPGKGSGRDGDPFLSVFITDEIRSAAGRLVPTR